MIPNAYWPHAPIHRLDNRGVYFVTGATLEKNHFFNTAQKLSMLENTLLKLARDYRWQLEAWAVFVNHYHVVARSLDAPASLEKYLNHLHSETARELNALDELEGRRVWYNYWDTKLTFERSYLARLNYVHQNPVRHGLVAVANQYRWCSARWFERIVSPAVRKTIYGFKIDKLRIPDDY